MEPTEAGSDKDALADPAVRHVGALIAYTRGRWPRLVVRCGCGREFPTVMVGGVPAVGLWEEHVREVRRAARRAGQSTKEQVNE